MKKLFLFLLTSILFSEITYANDYYKCTEKEAGKFWQYIGQIKDTNITAEEYCKYTYASYKRCLDWFDFDKRMNKRVNDAFEAGECTETKTKGYYSCKGKGWSHVGHIKERINDDVTAEEYCLKDNVNYEKCKTENYIKEIQNRKRVIDAFNNGQCKKLK